MGAFDLVIRGASVVDGTGAQPRSADVAVHDGIITEIGSVDGSGRREIVVDGALLAPGFVDIHTHYDGQATWDNQMLPSSWHGVTTVVFGNCGVGFAPVRAHDRDRLIELMEGVEDIPGTALHEGLDWNWESMSDFLDVLGTRNRDVDVAAQLPHGALRLYVMGERGANRERATADDIAAMSRLTEEGIRAGALGFTTSRTKNHRTSTGAYTPSLTASHDELIGIAEGVGRAGTGVLQMVSDLDPFEDELALYEEMLVASGRPLSLSVAQNHRKPEEWRTVLAFIERMNADGHSMRAQVAARGIGVLLGLQATVNPLARSATFQRVRAGERDLGAAVRALRDPSIKAAVVAELADSLPGRNIGFDRVFLLGSKPDYEPEAGDSIEARARRDGRGPMDFLYDELLAHDGTALLYAPIINYADGNLDHTGEMLSHPYCVPGLSDGGAHVGTICDASFPTTLLAHWGRDRQRGTLPLEQLVAAQSRRTAETVGLLDRGVIAVGMRADLNVIDPSSVRVLAPEIRHDLPAGGRRLLQPAEGYLHTFVAGVETYANGSFTGALPGRLVRGAKPRPNLATVGSA